MPTITTVDATWDTGVTMDAAELRRSDSAMFLGDGTANGVRGGVVRHGDSSLAVSVNGSDQITVQPGAFVIPAAAGLGVYRGALSAATAATAIATRNGTNPRIDLVVIQATGTNATVKTIEGAPSASPTAPALPALHIELARLNVPKVGGGAVTVDSTWRTYATGLGGTLHVETSARLPGSGNQTGQRAVALDTGIEYRWSGSAWITARHEAGAWRKLASTATFTNPSTNTLFPAGADKTALAGTVSKAVADTGLRCDISFPVKNTSGAEQVVYVGLRIGGADYEVGAALIGTAPSYATLSGSRIITGLGAGSLTIEPFIRAGAIALTATANTIVNWTAREVA